MGDAARDAVTLEAASRATPHTAQVECAALGMGAPIFKLPHKSE